MRPSLILRAQHRTPLIKFLGKRKTPQSVDHTPHTHPASPNDSLPESFASYRSKAQQHGPLGGGQSNNGSQFQSASGSHPTVTSRAYGAIGGSTGRSLGSIRPKEGEFFDRSELPARFRKLTWTEEEIEAVETAGASLSR